MDNPIYAYPIEKVLEALGAKKGFGKDMWFSPLRDETRASLHVNTHDNVWKDFGAGVGGTNVQLVMMARHCGVQEARHFIESLSPVPLQAQTEKAPQQKNSEVCAVKPIQSYYIKKYLESRKIPFDLAKEYCKEIHVHNHEKKMTFTLVGFPNNAGGYAMSAPSGFKSTTKAAPTFINMEGKISDTPSSKSVAVFEGFFDFLSWQVMQSSKKPCCDVVVLNSVNNLNQAASYITTHEKATCFLDNDPAGEKCYQSVRDLMKDKEVLDMSDLYGTHKDLNDMLQASRGYSSHMNLTPNI